MTTNHSTSRLNDAGQPEPGVEWAGGSVVRIKSRGPGVPVPAANPRGPKPTRVISGAASVEDRGGTLYVTPLTAEAGDELDIIVDFDA